MNYILKYPSRTILCAIPILILLSLLRIQSAVDFQFHDTYFVVAVYHIGILMGAILLVDALIYWLMRKRALISRLTVAHLLLVISASIFVVLFCMVNTQVITPRMLGMNVLRVSGFLIIISQVILLINVALSFSKNK